MLYREYGRTGEKVSVLGFGGMRFAHIDDHDECIRTMLAAAEGGVNYFDTAPGYFETKSETVFGKAFAEFRRRNIPFYAATKTFATTEDAIYREVEGQLKRLNIPAIDFYHIWSITNLDNWQNRKKDGVLQAFRKLNDEGLIRHICVSSHLIDDEIKELLMEGVFEGVLFGYSAYNFKTRQKAFDAIREKKLGAVVMNPLGGGVIPQHPERFSFLQRPGEGIVAAALHFLWDHPEISVTLVGFETDKQVQEALAAIENYKPRTESELAAVKAGSNASLEGICTGCSYCDDCPHEIPIPKFMDTYNQKIFNTKAGEDPIGNRLRWHWNLDRSIAGKCTACGQCEKACTQHIDIIKRLKEIASPSAAPAL
ncbi:MAG: aldo/keto reductase [Treponema sp.]|jgi:predicted aldo/keto reductase-like oxidoreductase|nr:aldo/keto reductase [Treponema sp.]